MFKNMKLHQRFFNILMYASYILYFIALTGLMVLDPSYIEYLNSIITFYMGIILFIKFNPWAKSQPFTKFDKRLVWSAGGFLLISSSITTAIEAYIKKFL